MNGSGDVTEILHNLSQANLIQVVMIVVGALLIIALSHYLLPWLAKRSSGGFRRFLLALAPAMRMLIVLVAIALIIPHVVEPTFENLVAFLGALGLALGFAFKDYVGSLIAGVVTLYEMPYRPGDWIEVDGTYGEVRDINMRTVEIVTPDDTVVHIPHMKIWDQPIFNANDGGQNLQCVADFYLHPHHDAAQIRQALYDVALTSAFLQIEQPIKVSVSDKPWGTHYRLKAYPIDLSQQFSFITDLTMRGKAVLISLGVEFASAAPDSGL